MGERKKEREREREMKEGWKDKFSEINYVCICGTVSCMHEFMQDCMYLYLQVATHSVVVHNVSCS